MVCEAIFAPRVSPELKSGKTFDDPPSTEEFRRVATPHAVTKSGEDVRAHRLKFRTSRFKTRSPLLMPFFQFGRWESVPDRRFRRSRMAFETKRFWPNRRSVVPVGLLLTLFAFLMKSGASFSRGSVICFGLLALFMLLLSRRLTKRFVVSAVNGGHVHGRRSAFFVARQRASSNWKGEWIVIFGISTTGACCSTSRSWL